MPIIALDPANTERWRLVYSVGSLTHNWVMRVDATGVAQTTVEAGFQQILTDLTTKLYTLSFVRLEHAAVGSSIFNPVTSSLSGILAGSGSPGKEQAVRTLSFVGRNVAGRKTRSFLYGYLDDLNDNMRITPAETTEVGTAINRINGYLHLFVCIDGIKPTYSQYVNINYNKHWTKEIRKT